MIKNIDLWITSHWHRQLRSFLYGWKKCLTPKHVLFTICDHYEPYWNNVTDEQAYQRVRTWLDNYPKIASRFHDSIGNSPKHCFFYPIEEYRYDLLEMVGDICRKGYGETEIHLHHDNDTVENLRSTLLGFVEVLSLNHGLLPHEIKTGDLKYGFIHGNWALNNSRPDGRWCGVNNETDVLIETGCYADFTMPSAPSDTQTKTVNSIYYATGDPNKPKSHDTGTSAQVGKQNTKGLLCIQGPLAFNFSSRKFGVLPRIENGGLVLGAPITSSRISNWINQQIHVDGRPDIIFVKLYTHGTQERMMDLFFKQKGLEMLFAELENVCASTASKLYYVSARQMFNVVKGLELDAEASLVDLFDSSCILSY